MLKLSLSPDLEKFRQEFKHWLSQNPPPRAVHDSALESFVELGRRWQAQLAEGRWVGVHWPESFGGRSLTLVHEAIIQEELVRAHAPQLLGLFGLTMVGPVLIRHGSEEQKKRFLSNILSAREIWCQGFSEPGAGSDLAALRTKGIPCEREGKRGFLVNGGKIWTSFGQEADWCFLLCRSVEGSERHEGLSYLLVKMDTPGITIRPLPQITGDREFNEVFFEDVFVPEENLVGEIGEGWKIAISTLMYERVILTFSRQLQSETLLRSLLEKRDSMTATQQTTLAQEVAQFCAVRALAYDHLVDYQEGRTPGPEGSLDKLFWSESFQSLTKFALECQGPDAALSEEESPEVHRYLYARGRTIAAGTSEIQKNIIAERIMRLPKLKYRE